MTIKKFIEDMTDQRIHNNMFSWLKLQHTLYVKILRRESTGQRTERNSKGEMTAYFELPRSVVITITNTPF